ncbi:hypothetical protein HS088_TW16G00305 [Tripterygium wilfordii]|uniref:Uncharacterized protein n=1 Tax=Tripterygium wilfordii TaxID=458696 RepID=A0A7J7CIJ8_TRIWF|nr:uncharacterized protein LOC119980480 [Tripterygium wilfordii]KAF5733864.1 hypothetical protein HS088_TW16G00305 [Tripterygium wilfordii]
MTDMEPPSFSLGLDLDAESEPRIPSPAHSNISPAQDSPSIANLRAIGDDNGFRVGVEPGLQVMDSDPDSGPEPLRVFRRLRRGPAKEKLSAKKEQERLVCDIGDEDIEEFSSQEDIRRDTNPAAKYSICSSSKVPLHTRGILTNQSSNHCNAQKWEQLSVAPASANLETSQRGFMFPRLTVSPIRRFQLIDSDSDSDDPSVSEDLGKGTCKIEKSPLKRQRTANEQKRKASVCKPLDNNLWKDFCPTKSFHVTTPVLDEFCDEYFQSMKNNGASQKLGSTVVTKMMDGGSPQNTSGGANFDRIHDLTDPLPPAHSYFYHEDPRIQKLVRFRLPHFSPLIKNEGNQLPHESLINYMNQFGNGETSTGKGTQKTNCKSSRRGRNKSKNSNYEDPHAREGWVNPKSIAPIPRDAGKQRVHATGQAAGHWFTSPEGRKVYVSKTGQEFTGQTAYRCYKKESGSRFRKSKKKVAAKKVKS